MFKYSRDRDRFAPDRPREPYSFRSVDRDYVLDHRCVCPSPSDAYESGFLEPFECERLDEQQHRTYLQLEAYMSPELNGGHLLRPLWTAADDENDYKNRIAAEASRDATWPVSMVRQRKLARKCKIASTTYAADLLLDMPNLSDCWRSKVLDWSSTGYLTAAIESSVHLWSCRTQSVRYTVTATAGEDEPAAGGGTGKTYTDIVCLKWDSRGEMLAYSFTVEKEMILCTCLAHIRGAQNGPPADGGLSLTDGSSPSTDGSLPSTDGSWYSIDGSSLSSSRTSGRGSTSSEMTETLSDTVTNDPMRGYVKVWLLSGQKDASNSEQKSSQCGCSPVGHSTGCYVAVMDWLANSRVLVAGCTRVTVTFFKYDHGQKQLIALSAINGRGDADPNVSITGLHVSLDRLSRHVALATYSGRMCKLKVWRIDDPPEQGLSSDRDSPGVNVTVTMVDRYDKRFDTCFVRANWMIQACAWHPWKHSLICYAVMASVRGSAPSAVDGDASWFVLANACNGEVLKRVKQTSCYANCPTVRALSVVTHTMTFSRITGELLVSSTTVYGVEKNGNSSGTIIKRHSVVVMHALNKIVETLSSSNTAKGLFFTWNPEGTQIALACSDESLRIWNFWPTAATRRKSPDYSPQRTHDNGDDSNGSRVGNKHNNNNYCYPNNHFPAMISELSLDASRVIK